MRSVADEETAKPTVESDDYNPYTVTIEVGPNERRQMSSAGDVLNVRTMTRNHALIETNADAWLYARVAFLFFCSLLICWVPSSINRIYSIAYPDKLVFWLNYIEALVLPLQGFLNSIVYIVTSQTACRNLWRRLTGGQELPRKTSTVGGMNDDMKLERFKSRRASERLKSDTSSTTSLRTH